MPERVDLLVTGGTVVTVDAADTVLDGDVAVRDGRIVAIGPDLSSTHAADRVLDASCAAVVPGFVNAHMHETIERGFFEDMPFMTWLEDFALPKDRAYEPRHMVAAGLLNQAEMILGGTTSFIDIFRFPHEAATVAERSGLRATFSPQVIDDPVGPGETYETNLAFVDAWHGRNDRIRTWFGPHSLYTTRASTYEAMREQAEVYGVGIHTHLAESRAETTLIAERTGGLTPTQYLDRLVGLGPDRVLAHCVELTDGDLARIAESGAGVAHCPTSNAKLGNGVARVTALLGTGATVGLGTDSTMTNNNLDMVEEMRMASLVQKQATADPTVLPSATVLRMATQGSADVLGLGTEIGSLEVGKTADLAVVDLRAPHARPLLTGPGGNVVEQVVWSCGAADVRHTVCDGVVLMEDRRLLTIDLDEVGDLVDREAVHLLSQAGVLDTRSRRNP
ncbi:amidohydrolase [Iamia sp. SCSIO 61187]|uniref:amidohydrolase family protein n=1 Tax=Iamia sp. SCSIO 61187 TaxID=2722752 RepID=UPI001C63892C|nr:amidohydrolase [Iamia sp. SCSIO 61187]QYG91032.1 amidohydrolase [Iamia sp. SCSIO 61187]